MKETVKVIALAVLMVACLITATLLLLKAETADYPEYRYTVCEPTLT